MKPSAPAAMPGSLPIEPLLPLSGPWVELPLSVKVRPVVFDAFQPFVLPWYLTQTAPVVLNA